MRLDDIAGLTMQHLFGRLLRRAAGMVLLTVFAVVAFYYLSAAGTVALSAEFGLIQAYLIMAAAYAAAAAIAIVVLWATRNKPPESGTTAGALASPRNMQIAMLIEAVMLGYSLARKSGNRIR